MVEQYQRSGLSRDEILSSRKGEIIKYDFGYLIVESVDIKRGVVNGELKSKISGVNAFPIKDLEERGIDIAKWQRE